MIKDIRMEKVKSSSKREVVVEVESKEEVAGQRDSVIWSTHKNGLYEKVSEKTVLISSSGASRSVTAGQPADSPKDGLRMVPSVLGVI